MPFLAECATVPGHVSEGVRGFWREHFCPLDRIAEVVVDALAVMPVDVDIYRANRIAKAYSCAIFSAYAGRESKPMCPTFHWTRRSTGPPRVAAWRAAANLRACIG